MKPAREVEDDSSSPPASSQGVGGGAGGGGLRGHFRGRSPGSRTKGSTFAQEGSRRSHSGGPASHLDDVAMEGGSPLTSAFICFYWRDAAAGTPSRRTLRQMSPSEASARSCAVKPEASAAVG